jgi:transglutaminase-like putative cysteine protease
MMICRISFIVFLALSTFSITQTTGFAATSTVPNVVTADIEAGIQHYIEEQMRLGGGYFTLPFKEKELKLKLVRVHTEYLANLGPRYHFACVDVADIEGDLYDVDFFLKGDPGSMTVTETTVHKINGQPFYTWEQKEDKTWQRVAIEEASRNLLGVLNGHDEFDFLYTVTLPEITEPARMWLPLPTSDAFQTVEISFMEIPGKRQILKDKKYGNQILLVNLDQEDSGKNVELIFHVRRIEKDAYSEPLSDSEEYLNPNRLVPLNEDFKSIAEKIVKGKNGDLVRARALYDYVIDNMQYIRNGEGWGNGDAVYACNVKTGNCTDFHSYFIALSRSIGIPARFAIGAAIPSSRDEGGIHGYHCGAEFYAEGKWWPVDISEADKYSNLSSYYFGRHPANRIEFSRGRDLIVEPGPVAGPINFLAHPVLEIGGKPAKIKAQFSFNRNVACKGS